MIIIEIRERKAENVGSVFLLWKIPWKSVKSAVKYRNLIVHECAFLQQDYANEQEITVKWTKNGTATIG